VCGDISTPPPEVRLLEYRRLFTFTCGSNCVQGYAELTIATLLRLTENHDIP
jgi:hypothetical protein